MENKTIPELQSLLDAVEKKYGRPIAAHNDFNTLSVVLDHECHEILSSSTLKRLWGYVSLRTTPRKSTLDILSSESWTIPPDTWRPLTCPPMRFRTAVSSASDGNLTDSC